MGSLTGQPEPELAAVVQQPFPPPSRLDVAQKLEAPKPTTAAMAAPSTTTVASAQPLQPQQQKPNKQVLFASLVQLSDNELRQQPSASAASTAPAKPMMAKLLAT
jgi:hypothetical protein